MDKINAIKHAPINQCESIQYGYGINNIGNTIEAAKAHTATLHKHTIPRFFANLRKKFISINSSQHGPRSLYERWLVERSRLVEKQTAQISLSRKFWAHDAQRIIKYRKTKFPASAFFQKIPLLSIALRINNIDAGNTNSMSISKVHAAPRYAECIDALFARGKSKMIASIDLAELTLQASPI